MLDYPQDYPDCPTCEAPDGRPCIVVKPQKVAYLHPARLRATLTPVKKGKR